MDAINNIVSNQTSTGAGNAAGGGKTLSTQDIIAFADNLDTKRAVAQDKPAQSSKAAQKSSDNKDVSTKEADAKSAAKTDDAKNADAKKAADDKNDAKVADRKDVKAGDAAKSADAATDADKAAAQTAADDSGKTAAPKTATVATGTPAAPLVTLLQDDSATTDLQQNLQQLFNKLPGTDPQSLAQFRTDAIKMMKSQGMSDSDIQQNLVQFAINQGDTLTTAQATQIMMPLQADTTPAKAASKDDADMAAIISRRKPQAAAAKTDAAASTNVAVAVATQVTKQVQNTGAKASAEATAAAVAPLQADQAAAPAATPAAAKPPPRRKPRPSRTHNKIPQRRCNWRMTLPACPRKKHRRRIPRTSPSSTVLPRVMPVRIMALPTANRSTSSPARMTRRLRAAP